MTSSYLHLRRRSQWLSRWRAFRVLLDGQCIGKLKNGAACTYEIPPGEHEIEIQLDWVSSGRFTFDCAAGDHLRLVCAHPAPSWRAIFVPHTLVSAIELDEDQEESPIA